MPLRLPSRLRRPPSPPRISSVCLPVQPPSSASPSSTARPSPRRAAAPSALAGDPDYLQDLCVAELNPGKLQPLPCTLPLHLCATPKMSSVVRIVVCCSGTDPEKAWEQLHYYFPLVPSCRIKIHPKQNQIATCYRYVVRAVDMKFVACWNGWILFCQTPRLKPGFTEFCVLASCIRLLFAISLSDYSLHQNQAYRFGVNLF